MDKNTNLLSRPLWLFILLSLALLVRMVNLGKYSFWIDEKVTLTNSQGLGRASVLQQPVFTTQDVWANSSITQAAIADDSGNGILHTYIASVWISMVGSEEGWVRLPSVFWGVLSVLLTFLLGRRLFDEPVAWLGAAIVAMHPLAIELSQEFRAYPQTLVFTLLSTLVLVRQIQASQSADFHNYYLFWIIYTLLIPTVFLSHYLAFILFFVHGLIVLAAKNKQLFLYFMGAAILGSSLCLIWMFNGGFEGLKVMAERNANYVQQMENGLTIHSSFKNVVGGAFEAFVPFSGNLLQYVFVFRIYQFFIFFALFSGLLIPIYYLFKGDKKEPFWGIALLMLSFFGIAVSTALALKSGHIISFQGRYSIWCLPYLAILLGWCIVRMFAAKPSLSRTIYFGLFAIWAILVLFSDYLVWTDGGRERKPNGYLATQAEILKNISPSDTLVYNNVWDAVIFNLNLPKNNTIPQKIIAPTIEEPFACVFIYSKEGLLLKRYETNFENRKKLPFIPKK